MQLFVSLLALVVVLMPTISTAKTNPYKTLVIQDISYQGVRFPNESKEYLEEVGKLRPIVAQKYRKVISDYLISRKVFDKVTDAATGAPDELVLQTKFIELQLGSPGRRMARFFIFFIPIGGAFDIEMAARLLDPSKNKELAVFKESTNTGWYKGDNEDTLVQYSGDLALSFAESIEEFMHDPFNEIKINGW